MIVDNLPKPSTLGGRIEAELRSSACTIQVNRYHWDEPREAIFKPDTPIVDIVLSRRSADLAGTFLEASHRQPRRVGDILFMPPSFTLHSRWDRGERRSMCCVLDAATFGDFFEFDWQDRRLEGSLDVCNGIVRGTMMRLVNEALSPGFASELLIEALSTVLAVELRRHFEMIDPEDAAREGGLSATQLRRVREAIEEEDADRLITVAELARCEGMSVRHFSRLFRAATGSTVSDFAALIRVDRAKSMLSDDRVLIKEVAYRCGFQSASSFSFAFRRATSLTPQQFRLARLGDQRAAGMSQ